MFRPQPISSTDARKHFTRLIKKVSFSSKSFVIQSYRQPLVRIVNENYIRVLEEVVGKKTVNQVMQIAGNDRLFESEKIEQIKKVFQRRLSGAQRPDSRPERSRGAGSPQQPKPKPKPQPQPPQKPATPKAQKNTETQKSVVARHASPKPEFKHPASSIKHQASNNRVLLLSNGKNYK